ncbi:MAG: TonB-dependent receptor [Candidatus Marinimicrobia bacterium]|nr:TonB-dependent receptor [Candidatus Neomarinimicrobiota bacterium]
MKNKLLILFLLVVNTYASQINGRVVDADSGAPLSFVNVIVLNTEIGAATDLNGNFLITGLEPGFYRLMASFIGYDIGYSDEVQINDTKNAFVTIELKQKNIELGTVTVQASTFEKIEESPLSVQQIQVSDIEKNPGANRDISKVIQSFPGVGSTVSFRNDVIVRGGGPSESVFYLDGIEIPNLNHFATQGASGGPVGIINPDFIQSVDYYSGAFPANRGDALSGVFDFKQKSGNKEKMNGRAVIGASELALTMDGPLGEKTTYLASVRRSYLQFLFGALGLPFLPTFNDYQFKTETQFDPKNKLTIVSLGALDYNRLNLDIDDPTEDQEYILSYLPESDQWNYMIGANYTHFRGKSFQNYIFSRNMLNNEEFKYLDNDDELPKIQDYKSQEIENKFRFENTVRVRDYKISMGLGLQYVKYNNDTYRQIFVNDQVVDKVYQSDLDFFKYAAFAQVSKPFFNQRLSLSLGMRTDLNNYSDSMSNPIDQISPRFSASYVLARKWNLNFNMGRYYQLPAYTTLGFRDNSGQLVNKENDLKYIGVNHIIAGFEYLPYVDSRIAVEGFYKEYSQYPFSVLDSVSIANKGSDFGVIGDEEVTSTSKGRAYGFEISGRLVFLNRLNTIFAYTFVRSEFADYSGDLIPSSWDSRHIFTGTVTKGFNRGWQAGGKLRVLGGLPYTPYDLNKSSLVAAWNTQNRAFWDFSRYNAERLDPFVQLDLRVDKQYNFRNIALLLYLDIQNILNYQAKQPDIILVDADANGNKIIENPEAPFAEQRYRLKRIENSSGTVLPTIGVVLDF